ncbi:MAG TPA: glycosyltransferase family 2 protein [bacterium]|nr:glycosyltransferase family 2 protein [bacterium]
MSSADPPVVSIITPAHNSERFLSETIRSVLAQTFSNWEMIIVDDVSTDSTPDLARGFAEEDSRIRVVRLPSSAGAGGARNAGMDAARGRYLAFLDSDDLWLPQKLEVQVEIMRSTGVAFTYAGYRMIDENGTIVGRPIRAPDSMNYRQLLKNTAIGCLTVMLDRKVCADTRMPALRRHEDLVMWYALLKRGVVARGIAQDLARYRIVRGSRSRNKLATAAHMWKVYREVERLALPDAVWCFAHYSWNAYWKNRA